MSKHKLKYFFKDFALMSVLHL